MSLQFLIKKLERHLRSGEPRESRVSMLRKQMGFCPAGMVFLLGTEKGNRNVAFLILLLIFLNK